VEINFCVELNFTLTNFFRGSISRVFAGFLRKNNGSDGLESIVGNKVKYVLIRGRKKTTSLLMFQYVFQ